MLQQRNGPLDIDIEFGARVIQQFGLVFKPCRTLCLFDQLERFGVDCRRRGPIGEFELSSGFEKDRELPAFRAEPESFFTTENVNVLFERSFFFLVGEQALFDNRAVDPAKARTRLEVKRAGHHSSLIIRCDSNCRLAISQQNDLGVLFHKSQVAGKFLVHLGFLVDVPPTNMR